tara:strand:- start:555 stop:1097 length:543 start_codon:yes stop_codon:yes gene_type:complete
MSIDRRIKDAIDGGGLVVFEPEFASDRPDRRLFLHAKLATEIAEGVDEWGRRVGRLQSDFEKFVMGQHVTLSMTPFQHKAAYMGLLDPASEGIWEIRSVDPKPGLRVFGKFPSMDTFVALNWEPRSKKFGGKKPLGAGKSLEYQIAMIEADQRWNEVLPGLLPLTGGDFDDYVSKNSSRV